MGSGIVVENKSRFDFEKTLEVLVAESEKRAWKIPAIHDLQQSLAKSGKNVRPVKVIEICKPEYSGKMLELSDERIISVMMPCRISVYVKDDDLTYISIINTGELAKTLPSNIFKVMKAASDEIFEITAAVI